jgi:hypothetical protein
MSKNIKMLSGKCYRRVLSLGSLAIFLSICFLEFQTTVTSVKAESEASSEAGLEAPAYLRRRRGWNRYQNQQNQQVKKERNQEARARNRQQRLEQKQLAHGPQIRTYGNGGGSSNGGNGNRRRRLNRSGQQGQFNQQDQFGQSTGPGQHGQSPVPTN